MNLDKIDNKFFIDVTQQEALQLIKSLTSQLLNNDPNIGRLESYTDKEEYFTIMVLPDRFKSTREYKDWITNEIEKWRNEGT